jgi:hypothetical protein
MWLGCVAAGSSGLSLMVTDPPSQPFDARPAPTAIVDWRVLHVLTGLGKLFVPAAGGRADGGP